VSAHQSACCWHHDVSGRLTRSRTGLPRWAGRWPRRLARTEPPRLRLGLHDQEVGRRPRAIRLKGRHSRHFRLAAQVAPVWPSALRSAASPRSISISSMSFCRHGRPLRRCGNCSFMASMPENVVPGELAGLCWRLSRQSRGAAPLPHNDCGQVAQRVVKMVGSEGRELNVLAGKRPYRRPIVGCIVIRKI
jgi:hypothetical protein